MYKCPYLCYSMASLYLPTSSTKPHVDSCFFAIYLASFAAHHAYTQHFSSSPRRAMCAYAYRRRRTRTDLRYIGAFKTTLPVPPTPCSLAGNSLSRRANLNIRYTFSCISIYIPLQHNLKHFGAACQPHEMPTSVPSIGKLTVKRWRSRRGLMFIAGP